jgi:hypothetical protein
MKKRKKKKWQWLGGSGGGFADWEIAVLMGFKWWKLEHY